MSKFEYLKSATVLACYRDYFGGSFERLCNVWDSDLGRREKDVKSTGGQWKSGAKGTWKSKEGHEIQWNFNSALDQLVNFGMQVAEIRRKGSTVKPVVYEMDIQCVPPQCAALWSDKFIAERVTEKVETVTT